MSNFIGLLEKIESTLLQFKIPVYYGKTFAKENDTWDYFIFNRQRISRSGTNNIDINYQYQVHIISENYIEEDLEIQVIKALKSIGLKLVDSGQFNYVTKGNTDIVVEMLTLTFSKTNKGVNL